ncbi:MAG TPA: CRISPR-associated endonuclease Cas2 [bacterium]
MGDEKHWHLLCYDIREPKRWAKVYKILKGRGERIQLSVFRLQMTRVQNEELRWKLGKVMDKEDSLLILRLCPGCAQRIVDTEGDEKWKKPTPTFDVI